GDRITLWEHITIEVVSKNNNLQHVVAIGNPSVINFDYRRLSGPNSRLLSKLKYTPLVQKHNLPFLICIGLTFESWFKPEDLYEHLYGRKVVFHGNRPFGVYYPDTISHNIE